MSGVTGLAIAGLWYLVLALAGPFVALRRVRQGRPPRWRLALRNFALALGMVLSFVLTGLAVGAAARATGTDSLQTASRIVSNSGGDPLSVAVRVVWVIGIILVAVLAVVQVASVIHRRSRRTGAGPEPLPGRGAPMHVGDVVPEPADHRRGPVAAGYAVTVRIPTP